MAKNRPKANNTRAARRAASPSLDVDKSITSLPRAESPTVQRPSILADRANSGIQKKQKQKKLSRAQRLRQQKGMERAEAVLDQLEIKKAKSVNRSKSIKARRADWADTNQRSTALAALQEDDDIEDHDSNDAMATEKNEQPKSSTNAFNQAIASNHTGGDPALEDEEDEIL